MPDWTRSMSRTYEFYKVDPGTWKDSYKIQNIKSNTITRDLNTDTLGSATYEIGEMIGECYIRTYLVTIQNGITEKIPLGTFLVQTPSLSFDGRKRSMSLDAYTPLIELKENYPDIGYYIEKESNVMNKAYEIMTSFRETNSINTKIVRAPVLKQTDETKLAYDFVSTTDDTWMTFLQDLVRYAKYSLSLDPLGRISFEKDKDINSLQPIWTFSDDNSSILYPDINIDKDLYGVPNAVEVIYSNPGDTPIRIKVVNDDPNSPTSTVSRGREILYRETDLSEIGVNYDNIQSSSEIRRNDLEAFAKKRLKELSSIQYSVSYSHAYCPVTVGNCVRLNYERANIKNVRAKVISQSIECNSECKVTETAIITEDLWEG